MLSGIGPQAELAKVGIETRVDLPVGQNFHDSLKVLLNFKLKHPTKCQALGHPDFLKPQFFDCAIPADWIAHLPIPQSELQKAAQVDGIKPSLSPHTDFELIFCYVANPLITNPPGKIDGSSIGAFIVGLSSTSRG